MKYEKTSNIYLVCNKGLKFSKIHFIYFIHKNSRYKRIYLAVGNLKKAEGSQAWRNE